jgi:hypothetical protein
MKKYMEGKQAVAKLCPVCAGVGVGFAFPRLSSVAAMSDSGGERVCALSTEYLRALRRRSANKITVAVYDARCIFRLVESNLYAHDLCQIEMSEL